MKFSIITATLNSGLTVRDTVASILDQDYQDWEHIIVDGGSEDETMDIIREYEDRYEGRLVVVSGKDDGIYDAMNKGIAVASGDVIGILNSDDFFADKGILTLIADGLDGVDAVYGNLDFVDAHDCGKLVRRWIGSQYKEGCFLKGWHPAHPTFYARRDLYDRYGLFDLSFNVSADFELMLRFLERPETSSRYLDHTIVKMRMGGESTGSIVKIIRGNRNILRAFRKNGFHVSALYVVQRLAPKLWNMIRIRIGF